MTTAPDPTRVAHPVVYMRMRWIERENGTKNLRTEISCGYVSKATLPAITDGDWKLAGVVGPFSTLSEAVGFYRIWSNHTGTNEMAATKAGACRGIPRMIRGMVLARVFAVDTWIDFPVVYSLTLRHYELILDGKVMRARLRPSARG